MSTGDVSVIRASSKLRARQSFVRFLDAETSAIRELFAFHPSAPLRLIEKEEARVERRGRLPITDKMADRLARMLPGFGRGIEEVEAWLSAQRGWASIHEITRQDYRAVCEAVEAPRLPDRLRSEPGQPLVLHDLDLTVDNLPVRSSALTRDAGNELVLAVKAWAERWRIGGVQWVEKWAIYSLLRWDTARQCADDTCPHDCLCVRREQFRDAFKSVVDLRVWSRLEDGGGLSLEVSAALLGNDGVPTSTTGQATLMVNGLTSVNAPLPGPEPLLETREEFLDRASAMWDEAAEELRHSGQKVIEPRQLELHCLWLVQRHVCRRSVTRILDENPDRDPSGVRKAIHSMASLLEISLETRN